MVCLKHKEHKDYKWSEGTFKGQPKPDMAGKGQILAAVKLWPVKDSNVLKMLVIACIGQT